MRTGENREQRAEQSCAGHCSNGTGCRVLIAEMKRRKKEPFILCSNNPKTVERVICPFEYFFLFILNTFYSKFL